MQRDGGLPAKFSQKDRRIEYPEHGCNLNMSQASPAVYLRLQIYSWF